jgi:hypothetical protein
MQKKKLLVLLTLTALALCSTGAFAQCTVAGSNGLAVIPQVVAVGSSAQVNTFAYAAAELITAAAGDTGINTADFNIATATKGVTINDTRISPTLSDSANPAFVIFDNKSTCNMYAYFTTDSGVGIKDFFATEKYTPVTGHTYDVTALTITFGTNSGGKVNQIPGLTDNYTWAGLPTAIVNFFAAPWLPTYSGTTLTNHPLAYCGSTASAPTTNGWCLFNMAATDIRPEDALYATTRALTTLVTTTYAGLGYNNPTCLAGAGTSTGSVTNTPELQGCPILDSFAQKKIFNVLSFKLSGTDPFTAATVPPYTTISMGAVPVVVFVGNYDTAGFGAPTGTTPYTINNVNRNVLSQVFQGDLHCTGDFLPSVTNNVGVPIQEVQREPLSGTYNTFEFNAVRTLTGSSNAAIGTASATSWASNGVGEQPDYQLR